MEKRNEKRQFNSVVQILEKSGLKGLNELQNHLNQS